MTAAASMAAARENMMMTGVATGKGLNVKGKSAKTGVLSGFVPFLQISEEADKARVRTIDAASRVRVFFRNEAAREQALGRGLAKLKRVAAAAPRVVLVDRAAGLDERDAHPLMLPRRALAAQCWLSGLRRIPSGRPRCDLFFAAPTVVARGLIHRGGQVHRRDDAHRGDRLLQPADASLGHLGLV